MIMEEVEKIFWEEVDKLPEHKRTFDEDVFQTIIRAMLRFNAENIKSIIEEIKDVQSR